MPAPILPMRSHVRTIYACILVKETPNPTSTKIEKDMPRVHRVYYILGEINATFLIGICSPKKIPHIYYSW
ncbi:MAG: hypothetical protein DRN20_02595 [Thermoplasmata archaeon]|nr:MAG: hypothetical protein DRN20_02595 [Thermoplasmata archaeon]